MVIHQKLKESMLQNTRLQGNGCRSPRSDDNMNDSFVKILYMRIKERGWGRRPGGGAT